MLTGTQLLFQPVVLNISVYVLHIHISCSLSDSHSVLSVPMLTYCVKSWKLLITKFTLEGDIRFWGGVPLSNMVNQTLWDFVEKLGHWVQYNVTAEQFFM